MKYLFVYLLISVSIYSQDITHFRIYADAKKEPYFKKLLVETMLDEDFKGKFQIVVDIKPIETAFIVIGRFESPDVEWDGEAFRYDWSFLSKTLREQILKHKQKIPLK